MLLSIAPVVVTTFPTRKVIFCPDGTHIPVLVQFHHAILTSHLLAFDVTILPSFCPFVAVGQLLSPLHLHTFQRTSCLIVHHKELIGFLVLVSPDDSDGADREFRHILTSQSFCDKHIVSRGQRYARLSLALHGQSFFLPRHAGRVNL